MKRSKFITGSKRIISLLTAMMMVISTVLPAASVYSAEEAEGWENVMNVPEDDAVLEELEEFAAPVNEGYDLDSTAMDTGEIFVPESAIAEDGFEDSDNDPDGQELHDARFSNQVCEQFHHDENHQYVVGIAIHDAFDRNIEGNCNCTACDKHSRDQNQGCTTFQCLNESCFIPARPTTVMDSIVFD